jgi:hypothetical protein
VKYAYFCAKCANVKSDPKMARDFAASLGLSLWVPSEHIPYATIGAEVGARLCEEAIRDAEVVICQPPIGRDCAWELGFAHGLRKIICVLGSREDFGDDWMTLLSGEFVS